MSVLHLSNIIRSLHAECGKNTTKGFFRFYLEAVEGNKKSEDVVGALKDPENSQISHHSFHSGVLEAKIQKSCYKCNWHKATLIISYCQNFKNLQRSFALSLSNKLK